jgi:hypothetical protein
MSPCKARKYEHDVFLFRLGNVPVSILLKLQLQENSFYPVRGKWLEDI